MPTARDMYTPKPEHDHWSALFQSAYRNGLLSEYTCSLLDIDFVNARPYVKNGFFNVAKITMNKMYGFDPKSISTPDVEMLCTIIRMITPAGNEPDAKSRQRWANQMIRFIESNLSISHKGKPLMGGTLNDLLVLYFEKIARKFVTKAKTGKDCLARIHEIRVACGAEPLTPEVIPEPVPEVIPEPVPEVIPEPVPETAFVDDRLEIPDTWDV